MELLDKIRKTDLTKIENATLLYEYANTELITDIDNALSINLEVRRICVKRMKKSKSIEWLELYHKTFLLSAPYIFDDYIIYLEKDRKPNERFYKPRRRVLKCVVDAMQDLTDDKLDELFISMPPRVGKTTLLMLYLTWIMGRDGEKTNLYSAYSDTITSAMYDGVMEILTDNVTYNWGKIFPKCRIPMGGTNAKMETIDIGRKKRYHSLTCRSLYGTLNGACDCNGLLMSDDLIGGIEEALNKDRLDASWSKVSNNLLRRAKENAKILWVGTRWSLIDPAGRRMDTLQNADEFKSKRIKIINLPALDENDESNFDYEYGLGFSTQYYKQIRAEFERNNDIASWMAQMMGEPIEREGALFTPETMKFFNGVLPGGEPDRIYMAVDVAWGGGDFVAAPICADYGNDSYVIDVVFDKGDKYVTRPRIINKILKHGIQAVRFEANNGGSEYKSWIEEKLVNEHNYRCNITSKWAPTSKAKANRIFDKAPEIREFIFLEDGKRSPEYSMFMNGMYSFKVIGKNKNDDAPDSMSQLASMRNGDNLTKVEVFDRIF